MFFQLLHQQQPRKVFKILSVSNWNELSNAMQEYAKSQGWFTPKEDALASV